MMNNRRRNPAVGTASISVARYECSTLCHVTTHDARNASTVPVSCRTALRLSAARWRAMLAIHWDSPAKGVRPEDPSVSWPTSEGAWLVDDRHTRSDLDPVEVVREIRRLVGLRKLGFVGGPVDHREIEGQPRLDHPATAGQDVPGRLNPLHVTLAACVWLERDARPVARSSQLPQERAVAADVHREQPVEDVRVHLSLASNSGH